MKRIPNLPRPVPEITVGGPVEGNDVIDCRITVSSGDDSTVPTVELAADGAWEVTVPASPVPLTDLQDLSEEPRLGDDGWRAAGAVLVRRLGVLVAGHPVRAKRHTVQIRLPEQTTVTGVRNLAQGIVLGGRPLAVTRRDPSAEVRSVHLDLSAVRDPEVEERAEADVRRGRILGSATALARDIGAVPPNSADLSWWRRTAKSIGGEMPGVRVKTHGNGWLERKDFGGVLATAGQVGEDALGFIEMIWDPAAAAGDLTDDRPDVLLVGSAVVPAVIRALSELGGPRKVVGLVPVHGVDAPSTVPGGARDVVEHVDGTTTQVPVAAGAAQRVENARRLALADAVAYGVQRYRPRRVVVAAPVSGASVAAVGDRTGAVSGDPRAVRRVTLRGARVGEKWWPMPAPEYLRSKVRAEGADLNLRPEGPDALTSATFLQHFADGTPCAVLDVTGPAQSDTTHGDVSRGSTGFAARTLVEWFRK